MTVKILFWRTYNFLFVCKHMRYIFRSIRMVSNGASDVHVNSMSLVIAIFNRQQKLMILN